MSMSHTFHKKGILIIIIVSVEKYYYLNLELLGCNPHQTPLYKCTLDAVWRKVDFFLLADGKSHIKHSSAEWQQINTELKYI
jgi:hypothetical protein